MTPSAEPGSLAAGLATGTAAGAAGPVTGLETGLGTGRGTGLAARGESGGPLGRNRVVATASIEAVAGAGGVTRLPVLASQVPLVLRRTPQAVYLVGGAAGPLGGDSLTLRIAVGAGAFLRVRTAAASIALPGLDGLESVLRVTVTVGAGGRLEYLPEPVVVAAGARHATLVSVTLAAGASLLLRDEVLLGRHGEAGGTARSELRVNYAGRPLLRQSLSVSGADPASLGPAVLAGHRAIGTLLRGGDASGDGYPGGDGSGGGGGSPGGAGRGAGPPTVAVMPLAGPGVLVTALADDAVTLRRRLERAVPLPRPPQFVTISYDLVLLGVVSTQIWVLTTPNHRNGSGPGCTP